MLFDKTGTLTLPEPEVVNAADVPPERLALAGRLALASRHPLAAAVARAAGAKAPLSDVNCLSKAANTYRVPIDLLHLKAAVGSPKQTFLPFTQPISSHHACILYVTNLIGVAGGAAVCTTLPCTGGVVQKANCNANVLIDSDSVQNRVQAVLNSTGFNDPQLANSGFINAASTNMCLGEVRTEVAINMMPSSTSSNAATNVEINVLAQPRLHGTRCTATQAPLLCFQTNKTNIFPGGPFGDADGDVCDSEFLLTGIPAIDFPNPSIEASHADDPTLQPIAGDILDTGFTLTTNVPPCNSVIVPTGLCTPQLRRICYNPASECAL